MNLKKNQALSITKKILIGMLSAVTVLSMSACKGDDIDLSYDTVSSGASSNSPSGSADIQGFPAEKQSHSVMDDGNYYLKVQTVNGDKTFIREFAAKGNDVYANLKEGDKFEWYYSNGEATFIFDDENKTYEIYSFGNLFLEIFSDKKVEEGECKFFDVDSKFVKYKFDETAFIIHFYRKSDGSWLGFQYMYNDEYEEANIILEASENYPDHAKFSIPEDYEYIFEKGDTDVSIDWS